MLKLPFLNVQISKVIPKRRKALIPIVGNAFTGGLPFNNLPWIVDKTADKIEFRSIGILPWKVFQTSGEIELEDESVKTKATLSMNLLGLLLLDYVMHWIVGIILWVMEEMWIAYINPELVSQIQDLSFFLLAIWPGILFLIQRYLILKRMKTFIHNLVFHI